MNQDIHKQIDSFIGNIDEKPALIKAPKNDDVDDEFERLLQEFISSELTEDDTNTIKEDEVQSSRDHKPRLADLEQEDEVVRNLYEEEKALYAAHRNFHRSIREMTEQFNLVLPEFSVTPDMIYPRYKPSVGESFALDTLKGWDIMIAAHPARILNIKPHAKDEELLDFAERTTDETLQMAVISYVEILIEIETCEIAYEKRRLKAKRRKFEREAYEAHQQRIERIKKYIAIIQEKQFPINAERLVMNYFKTAHKDADGAYQMLINNPATFAPIEISKIKSRFFGMLKAKPEDGIRINRELGNFLKNLKI